MAKQEGKKRTTVEYKTVKVPKVKTDLRGTAVDKAVGKVAAGARKVAGKVASGVKKRAGRVMSELKEYRKKHKPKGKKGGTFKWPVVKSKYKVGE